MKRLGIILAILVLPWHSRAQTSDAWQMEDVDLKRWITFHVTSTQISHGPRNRSPHRLIQRMQSCDLARMSSLMGKARDIYFEGDRLMRRGKQLAVLQGEQLRFTHLRFTIGVRPRPKPVTRGKAQKTRGGVQEPAGGPPRWRVVLMLGSKLLAEGDAMALCAKAQRKPEVQQQEIRRRVALYLAWRRVYRRQ